MPRNPRGSWGRRLLWTQMAVVAAMAATTVLTAVLVHRRTDHSGLATHPPRTRLKGFAA